MKNIVFALLFGFLFFASCQEDPPNTPPVAEKKTAKKAIPIPRFDKDQAYDYVAKQVDFGPRVPNTDAHEACKNWIVDQLQNTGAKVIEQDFKAKAYTGETLNATNIIASFNSEAKKRVVLAAHWDTRPISDYDPDVSLQKEPVPGADDGGSGVAVLLEVANKLKETPIDIGIDIVFFDAEDYGESKGDDVKTWCLGSQYWSNNPHTKGYKAKYGILLDMVGSKGARFTKEEISMSYAPTIMNKVWKLANNMGFGNYFTNDKSGTVVDDHLFVNQITGIPTIDIINRPPNSKTGFGTYWHTHEDDMGVIDKNTLRAVGQTVLAVIYNESNGKF